MGNVFYTAIEEKYISMKRIVHILLFSFLSLSVPGQQINDDKERNLAFYNATKKWFSAWKLISKEIYKIDKLIPVDFVFFDDKYVYSTSTYGIQAGNTVRGNNFMNLKFQWKRKQHNDSLILPDKTVLPLNLMSFAAENAGGGKPFFVMPLPGFWAQAGVSSKELGMENLITGVFLHEFSHSQQMQNFGKKITEYEGHHNFNIDFNDDIVQNIFSKDTSYSKLYAKEIEFFYSAIKSNMFDEVTIGEGLSMLHERQAKYFRGEFKSFHEIDNLFLTMEGLGQYSMFLWLTHSKGGNLKKEVAIDGVRRGGSWWSQDEGFALFLILEKLTLSKKWIGGMFGDKTESVTDLIYRNLQ